VPMSNGAADVMGESRRLGTDGVPFALGLPGKSLDLGRARLEKGEDSE
jgi:hypothetical protein